jgi:hypothetical protein
MDSVGRIAVGIVVAIAIVMLLLYARGVPDHGPVTPAVIVEQLR